MSGGGQRVWAHIGALRAIIEAGIPIDAAGGTSGGAIMAAYYALHETPEDINSQLRALSDVTRKAVSWTNLTWPAISLFNSKNYTLLQKTMFHELKIENLLIPFFCVSCNLTHNTEAIHRSGYIWEKLRASTAIPGIFPPVIFNNELHFDGGLLNYLPVDVMRKIVGSKGKVIAIELNTERSEEDTYNFPPILSLAETLLSKLGLGRKKYKFPPLFDTFLKSLLVGSSVKMKQNSLAADLLINPEVTRYGMLNVTRSQEDELVEVGYQAAVAAIQVWLNKQTLKS